MTAKKSGRHFNKNVNTDIYVRHGTYAHMRGEFSRDKITCLQSDW